MTNEKPCGHTAGKFIGVQYNPLRNEYISLFNCTICKTTFSVPISVNSNLENPFEEADFERIPEFMITESALRFGA
ncbi:hypothetical protein ISS30_00265 [bacterium]|nr:hypothetical protein [bacterium]